ncbi:hypothetical protein V2G26_007751 [Clonostachys chloroleuca]
MNTSETAPPFTYRYEPSTMGRNDTRVIGKDEYTVGWVCALPSEMAAAKMMLDEIHPNLVGQDSSDHNNYILGQIQNHNVVIATLPAGVYGTTSAATVAKDMLRTFRSIRFGLMVGIGGGAPSPTHDIRLGDVVVSKPSETSGGVIQYDRGKTVQGGEFQRTGALNAPPVVLLTALNHLEADHCTGDTQIPRYLSEMTAKRPKMRKEFGYQGASNDCLYRGDYDHPNLGATCDQCDGTQEIARVAREDEEPVVHYGIIASGNQVIKHGATRDRLSEKLGVLCFEMEAAGLMPDFPCLVIRGICDYADSHKNKRWQKYAAATAAAFAKELLSVISPKQVLQEKPVPQLVKDPELHGLVSSTNVAISEQTRKQGVRYENEKQFECHRTFRTSDYEKFKNVNPDRVSNTCRWVLEHPQYRKWQQSPQDDLLWISADPGCGKSVLSKSLVENELRSTDVHTVCYFFFKDNEEQDTIATALCALLHQLFRSRPSLLRYAMAVYEKDGEKLQKEVDELWRVFLAAATDERANNVTCVIDALDECRGHDRPKLIQILTNFYARRATISARKFRLKFLVTSRPYQDIESGFNDIPPGLPSIRLAGEESNADISKEINLVIEQRVADAGRKLHLDQEVQNVLKEKLLATSHRTYLWLHLVIEDLYHNSDKRTSKAYKKKIDSLPTTVEDAYEKILSRPNGDQQKKARTLLHIVVGARRPLTLSEMDVAFDLAIESKDARAHKDLDPDQGHLESRIRDLCGLFVFVNDSRIYLIHQTAKEFLIKKASNHNPTDGYWKHSLQVHDSDIILAQICVQYLSFGDIDDDSFSTEVREDRDTSTYPFLEYSAVHWPAHFRNASSNDRKLLDRIYKLYDTQSQRFQTWVSMFSRATMPYEGVPQMNILLASFNGHSSVLLQLLHAGRVKVNTMDRRGRTALYFGSQEGHETIVQLLVEKGADINAQGGEYGNALQAASQEGHETIVQLLVEKGADINAQGGVYGNALQAASQGGHETIVQLLVEKGADINAQGGVYGNALQAASQGGHETIVQLLVEKGAGINAQGGVYGNALQAASLGGHKTIVQLLVEKGASQEGHKQLPVEGGAGDYDYDEPRTKRIKTQ